jgi:hypothetical protein
MYKSTKDTRNHVLWNPKEKSLQNVEVDEAGKLAAFRERFGRGWDAESPATVVDKGQEVTTADETMTKDGASAKASAAEKDKKDAATTPEAAADEGSGDGLADLIAGYAVGIPELPMKLQKSKPKKK